MTNCTLCPGITIGSSPARHALEVHGDQEMIVGSTETYPATITTPPARIGSRRVLAWTELRRQQGTYPSGYVLCSPGDEQDYVCWRVYTKDGGRTWSAETGHYYPGHAGAWQDFLDRCTYNPDTLAQQ